ncbi:MAG: DUF4258 domain-containing protein [Methanobacteriota archaeon]
MKDFHLLPIKYTKHASDMLRERFQMDTQEVRHYLKTGRHIKKVEKEGNIGIIEGRIGDSKIRFVYTIRQGIVWIITVEE